MKPVYEGYTPYVYVIHYKNIAHAIELVKYIKRTLERNNDYTTKFIVDDNIVPFEESLLIVVHVKNGYENRHFPQRKYQWKSAWTFRQTVDDSQMISLTKSFHM